MREITTHSNFHAEDQRQINLITVMEGFISIARRHRECSFVAARDVCATIYSIFLNPPRLPYAANLMRSPACASTIPGVIITPARRRCVSKGATARSRSKDRHALNLWICQPPVCCDIFLALTFSSEPAA